MWTRERCVATDEPAVATTTGGRQWELLPLPALVQWTWLPTCARETGCKIDPLDWLLADSGWQPKGKESATCSTLPAPSLPPVPRQNPMAGRKECGISKTCFRATQGESESVWWPYMLGSWSCQPVGTPPVPRPLSMLPTGLLFDLPSASSQMQLMIFSLFQAELAHPVPSWDPPCLVVAPMRRFAHLS